MRKIKLPNGFYFMLAVIVLAVVAADLFIIRHGKAWQSAVCIVPQVVVMAYFWSLGNHLKKVAERKKLTRAVTFQ